MKSVRQGWHPLQREELRDELVHDSYKSKKKLPEPTRCPDCGAVYEMGRWTWGTAATDAHQEPCPACHRVRDHFPAGYVTLEPEPPKGDVPDVGDAEGPLPKKSKSELRLEEALSAAGASLVPDETTIVPPPYQALFAHPTPKLHQLLMLRSVNPIYGVFLVGQLGIANREERLQAMESALELPRSVAHFVRVPDHDELPPGPLATTRLDEQLLRLGLVTADQLAAPPKAEPHSRRRFFDEERTWVLTLAEKLRLQFDWDFPTVHDVHTEPVWAAGELLEFGGDFNKYTTGKHLQKQEGIIFRHLLRLILLAGELAQLRPPDTAPEEWQGDLQDIAQQLTASCHAVDPSSTDKALEQAQAAGGEIDL